MVLIKSFYIFMVVLCSCLLLGGGCVGMVAEGGVVESVSIMFMSNGYELVGEIFYPEYADVPLPCIVVCQGLCGYIEAYAWLAEGLAAQGYVVMIFDFPGQGHSEGLFKDYAWELPGLNLYFRFFSLLEFPFHYFKGEWIAATSDALTFLVENSPVTHMVNGSCVGLIGHSYGGITVTETAVKDSRVDAVVALSQGNTMVVDEIDVPVQFQGGCWDLGTFSVPIVLRCYHKAEVPKQMIAIKRGTHFGFSTAFNRFCPCPRYQKQVVLWYAGGWFDYYLKNDSAGLQTITMGIEGLSQVVRSRYNFGDGDVFLI